MEGSKRFSRESTKSPEALKLRQGVSPEQEIAYKEEEKRLSDEWMNLSKLAGEGRYALETNANLDEKQKEKLKDLVGRVEEKMREAGKTYNAHGASEKMGEIYELPNKGTEKKADKLMSDLEQGLR